MSPSARPRRRKRWPNPCWIPCRRTDKSRPGLLRNLPKSRLNRLRGELRRLNPRLPGWFPNLKPRLRKKSLRPNRLEIAPARKCRLKILRRHPNRMGISARRGLPVCRGQPIPGTSPHTGKHPRGCPNRKQLPDQGRKRALPFRLPEQGRILRQRRSRSRRPCSASKRRPSATAINSGRKACSGTCRGGRRKTRGRAAAASNRQSGNRQPGTGIRPWRFCPGHPAYVRRG